MNANGRESSRIGTNAASMIPQTKLASSDAAKTHGQKRL